MSKTPHIYLVDDNAANLELLSGYLAETGYTLHSYTSGEAFVNAKLATAPGCIILDNMMPGLSGLDVQSAFIARNSTLPVIFMSGDSSYEDVFTATRNGALAFLQKPVNKLKLLEVVEQALARSQNHSDQARSQNSDQLLYESLSAREKEIFKLLVDGKSNKMISRKLDIALRTVEFHRANIQKKLKAGFLSELISIARNAGL